MSSRWDSRDWPELHYARPPRRRTDWAGVGVYSLPILCWVVAILLVLVAKGWV